MLFMRRIVVIGAGAAGMMAAGAAAGPGNLVLLVEKNRVPGKKVLVTGGGRCNITNVDDAEAMLGKALRNPRFLNSALRGFDSADMLAFLDEIGLEYKVEEKGRVFPLSDRAQDFVDALYGYLRRRGVDIRLNCKVAEVSGDGVSGFVVALENGERLACDAVIVATGGLSAPGTGSDGDGYRFARALGHSVGKLYPSIVALVVDAPWTGSLMGIGLEDICLTVLEGDKAVFKDAGAVMFTHFGISGPVVLRASAYLADKLHLGLEFCFDMKPEMTVNELDGYILDVLRANSNKGVGNALKARAVLPEQVLDVLLSVQGIAPDVRARDLTTKARRGLAHSMKRFGMMVKGSVGFGGAVITSGGVDVRQINASTMESKLVCGLYFAGELIDVDALTGGYNLQIAFSTGRLAGLSAAGKREAGGVRYD